LPNDIGKKHCRKKQKKAQRRKLVAHKTIPLPKKDILLLYIFFEPVNLIFICLEVAEKMYLACNEHFFTGEAVLFAMEICCEATFY
jgi:hypothetical protein